jgi:hypothetical protein
MASADCRAVQPLTPAIFGRPMTYREQEYVDHCYCDAPATAFCTMCNRPRCAAHLEARGHCHRCNEAVAYELAPRAGVPWTAGLGVTIVGTVASLVANAPTIGLPIASVAGALTFVATKLRVRRATERRLAPKLAATVGEVEPRRRYDAPRTPSGSGHGLA